MSTAGNRWTEEDVANAVTAAVEGLEVAGEVDDLVRRRARRSMYEAFGAASDESIGASPRVEPLDETMSPNRRIRPWLLATAAVAAALLVSGLVWLGDRDPEVPADLPPPPSTVVPLPTALEPGTYSTDALGFDLEFTLDAPATVERLESGLIELSAVSATRGRESIAFVRPTALASGLEVDSLDELLRPSTGVQRQVTEVDGIVATSWELYGASEQGPCANSRCESLFEQPRLVGISSDRYHRIVEVPVSDGVVMMVVTEGDVNTGSGPPFGAVFNSASIGAEIEAPPVIPRITGSSVP